MNKVIKIVALALVLFSFSCKKKIEEQIVYDNVIYGVDDVEIYSSNAQKTSQKSAELLVSIMYADIFNQGINTNTLLEVSEIYIALGDKTMFNELIFSHFFKDPTAVVPSDVTMRADIDTFIEDSYIRFFQRNPSEYEKHYLKDLIANDNDITVENVYTSFVLSNEYYFY
jgi:hypothetical protein